MTTPDTPSDINEITKLEAEWKAFVGEPKALERGPDGFLTKASLKKVGFRLAKMRDTEDWPAMAKALKDLGIDPLDSTTWPMIGGKQLGILILAYLLAMALIVNKTVRKESPFFTKASALLTFLVGQRWVRKRSVLMVMDAVARCEYWDLHTELFERLLLPTFTLEPPDLEAMGGELLPRESWLTICGEMIRAKTPISLPKIMGPWSLFEEDPKTLDWCRDPSLGEELFSTLSTSLHTFLKEEYGKRGIGPFEELMASVATRDFTVVVDGANVLHCTGVKSLGHGSLHHSHRTRRLKPSPNLTFESWSALNALCHNLAFKGLKPLIVLHLRHMPSSLNQGREAKTTKPTKRSRNDPRHHPFFNRWGSYILWTSRGLNDDWFAIGAALLKKALLVTNDLFRDHVVAWASPSESKEDEEALKRPSSLIHPWAEAKHLRYSIRPDPRDGWAVDFMMPSPIAKRIHRLRCVLLPPTKTERTRTYSCAAVVEGSEGLALL